MIKRLFSIFALLCTCLFLLCASASADYQITVRDGDVSAATGLDPDIVNILLIGTDTWEDVQNTGRSDTMIVCSYDMRNGSVRLLSLARDLYVNIPVGGGQNRINAAHSFGGPNLLMKTVNQTLGLNITQYVSLNIYGLQRIVDAMGGLTLDVSSQEAQEVRRMISIEFPGLVNPGCPSGTVTLNGLQTMSFARIRDLDSDFGRMDRQRKVLIAMGQRAMQMSEEERLRFITACLMNVSTNLQFSEITSMAAAAVAHGLTEIDVRILPQRGTYIYENVNGMSVLLSEEKALQRDARAFIYEGE